MRTEFVDTEYVLRFTRPEIVVVISALSSMDNLMPSDTAFLDYVGCSREEFRALVGRIADFVRSVPFEFDPNSEAP